MRIGTCRSARRARIDAPQFRTVGGEVELHLAEARCAVLDRLREVRCEASGLRHVVAAEPGESARCGDA